MKRLMILALCLVFSASLLGCGKTPEATQPPLTPTNPPTAAPTVAPTEPYTETALVRNDQCSFTVTDLEVNEHLGLQIHVLCENTSDRPLMFSWNNTSVCGFMYEPMWAEEVAAGKKVNSTIGIDTYSLEQIGINTVEEVTFTLMVQDSEEFMNPPVVEQTHTIYPTGKTADTVNLPQYRHQEEETVIVDNEDLTFIIRSVDDELADLYTLNCYLANKTDDNLIVSWEDVSVNGFMVNPFWSVAVAAGKQAYSDVLFYRSDLEEQDIEVIQNIEFRLQAMDYDNWDEDYLINEIFTFKPQE